MTLKPEVKEKIKSDRNFRLELCKEENAGVTEIYLLQALKNDHVIFERMSILEKIAMHFGYQDVNELVLR